MDDIETILADMRRGIEELRDDSMSSTLEAVCDNEIANMLEHYMKRLERCLPDA